MDGILTASGVEEWISGRKQFVREFTTMLFDTASTGKYSGFNEDYQGGTMPANGTGLSLTFQPSECSLKTKGQFATKDWKATSLAIEVLAQVPTSTTAGNDTNPLVADLIEFNARTWFELFFTSSNDPHDDGRLIDFPSNVGFTGMGTTATSADTGASKFAVNGVVGGEPRPLKSPKTCDVNTRPRLDLSILSRGAIGVSVDMAVRPVIHGYKG
jgi:hypothetical protein